MTGWLTTPLKNQPVRAEWGYGLIVILCRRGIGGGPGESNSGGRGGAGIDRKGAIQTRQA